MSVSVSVFVSGWLQKVFRNCQPHIIEIRMRTHFPAKSEFCNHPITETNTETETWKEINVNAVWSLEYCLKLRGQSASDLTYFMKLHLSHPVRGSLDNVCLHTSRP